MIVAGGKTFVPRTSDEALDIWAAAPEARLVAGGTDLLVRLKDVLVWPPLIDLSHVDGLRGITCDDGVLRVGACTTYTELERNALIARHVNVLVEAAREVGSPAVRNRGTLAGNLANASPAGDTIPALYALEAELELRSRAGQRTVPVTEFFCGPGRTVLQSQELICAVRIPVRAGWRGAFERLGQRAALTISKVSAAVCVRLENDIVREARIALGAVAPTVVRAREAEAQLCGAPLSDEACAHAGEAAARAASPITDIRSDAAYRRAMCAVLVRDALRRCRAAGGAS